MSAYCPESDTIGFMKMPLQLRKGIFYELAPHLFGIIV